MIVQWIKYNLYIVIHKLLKQLKGLIIIGKEGRQDLLSSFDIAQIIVGSRLGLAKQDFLGLGAAVLFLKWPPMGESFWQKVSLQH